MFTITDEKKERILAASQGRLADVAAEFGELKKAGKDLEGTCPLCHSEKKFKVSPAKDIYKCWKCQKGGKGAVSYLIEMQGKSYPEALKYMAETCNILLIDEKEKQKAIKKQAKSASKSFCERQLEASGISKKDVLVASMDKRAPNQTVTTSMPFEKGGIDDNGKIDYNLDDMVIWYYDLDGHKVTYTRKAAGKEFTETFYRVRFSNPDLHLDKAGKAMKYKSPAGSGVQIYIPETIRQAYRKQQKIKKLFIQEGEKKAEKATKHGIMSLGIMGIHNMGFNNALPHCIQQIVQVCGVEEVIFLIDSDWDKISENIKVGDKVDARPLIFFYAVRNFRDYFKTFLNLQIYVESYFGHVNDNPAGDKGIDDLLTNTLKGKEETLLDDVNKAMNEKSGIGEFVSIHKISTVNDYKLMEFWSLETAERFALKHRAILDKIPEFKIGRHRWRFNSEGIFENAQPLSDDEQYWAMEEWTGKDGRERKAYKFKYGRMYNFLNRRGFGKMKMLDGSLVLIQTEGRIVKPIEAWEIKEFLIEFSKQICSEDIMEMIYQGSTQYLGTHRMHELNLVDLSFVKSQRDEHSLFFKSKEGLTSWCISKDIVVEKSMGDITNYVWEDSVKNFPAKLINEPIVVVEKLTEGQYAGAYDITFSKDGNRCHFLKFLANTSEFTWRKKQRNEAITPEEIAENAQHLMAKLTSFGYLVHSYKDSSVCKAVVCMDGRLSEVGSSNGRSGKSIYGKAIGAVLPQVYIPAKGKNLTDDQFLTTDVTEKHKNIFLDDVRANIDFEFFFPWITGNMTVNQKGGRRFTLGFEQTPKLLITTNHAMNGDGGSFKDRQWLVAFSDYYNETHKPIDDFGQQFFSDWDFEQWNLFYNLVANCIQLYLKYGVVESPSDRLELRRLRQAMGEDFLLWAEEYFSNSERLNTRIVRKDITDNFYEQYPNLRKFVTPTGFKKKLKAYCEYKGYAFNPHKFDPTSGQAIAFDRDGRPETDDKSGGKEFFTIGDERFSLVKFNARAEEEAIFTPQS